MAQSWKKNASEYESSAKVVDGNLILSLPDAINPIVWRMELGSVKASALEVRTQENKFTLLLKTPKGETHDIAPFETRELAVRALMRVSAALQGAQGKIAPGASPSAAANSGANSEGGSSKWIIALVGVAIVIVLFSYVNSMVPRGTDGTAITSSEQEQSSGGGSGVPESADALLGSF